MKVMVTGAAGYWEVGAWSCGCSRLEGRRERESGFFRADPLTDKLFEYRLQIKVEQGVFDLLVDPVLLFFGQRHRCSGIEPNRLIAGAAALVLEVGDHRLNDVVPGGGHHPKVDVQ